MPPDLRSPTFILRAAGFMATRTSRSSPGVKTSCEEKLSWKALTPASVPAGARISAGKSGRVARSLPASADSVVNCMPVTCMPSPESPAKRMTTVSRASTGLRGVAAPSSIGVKLYRGGCGVAILVADALRRRADPRRGGGPARVARRRAAAGRTRGHRGGRREPRRHARGGARARRPGARGAARPGAADARRRGRGARRRAALPARRHAGPRGLRTGGRPRARGSGRGRRPLRRAARRGGPRLSCARPADQPPLASDARRDRRSGDLRPPRGVRARGRLSARAAHGGRRAQPGHEARGPHRVSARHGHHLGTPLAAPRPGAHRGPHVGAPRGVLRRCAARAPGARLSGRALAVSPAPATARLAPGRADGYHPGMLATGAQPELSAEDVVRLRTACRPPVVDPRDGLFAPESVIRRVNREAVVLLGGGRALLLQIAHPLVAAAVAAHSRFRAEPLARLWRTLDLMLTIVFADAAHALAAAHEIERVHARVHGVLDADVGPWRRGTPYDANDPTLLLWVHATLVESALLVYVRFVAPLSPEDRATYYEESNVGARLLGIPDALVPPSHRAFEDYVDAMVRDDVLT